MIEIWVRSQDWLPIQEQQWGPWLSACTHTAAGPAMGGYVTLEKDTGSSSQWCVSSWASCLNELRGRPVTGVGVRSFGQCPERLGKLVTHSVLYFPTNKLSPARKLSVGSEQCWSGGWNDTVQAKYVI